jgi:hypothetical protein
MRGDETKYLSWNEDWFYDAWRLKGCQAMREQNSAFLRKDALAALDMILALWSNSNKCRR